MSPYAIIKKSIKVRADYDAIKFEDIFLEKNQSNYPLLVIAQKKFESQFPDKIYYINYYINDSIDSNIDYAVYFRNDSIFSTHKNLVIEQMANDTIKLSDYDKGNKIELMLLRSSFIKSPQLYNTYNDNGYGYVEMTKNFGNLTVRIRKEPEKDIIREHVFYRFLYWIT